MRFFRVWCQRSILPWVWGWQGAARLLAPDEEALLRHYRHLDVPTRAAVVQLVSRAAGPEPEPEFVKQAGRSRKR